MNKFNKNFCAIVSGGKKSSFTGIEKAKYIIACDKGLKYALNSNIIPNIVIGDFDSYNKKIPKNIKSITLPKEKDDTDTFYAIKYAIKNKFKNIKIYCATGNRFDHTLANIQSSIYAVKKGCLISICDDKNDIYIFKNNSIILPHKNNYSLSVFSLSNRTSNVTINNAKYKIKNKTMFNYNPIGVSNEWLNKKAVSIKCENGILMVICSNKC